MNTLLHYDLLRLEAFKKNDSVKDAIAISQFEDLTLLKFCPVNYFNYCFGKVENHQVLDLVKEFYSDTVQRQHQILIDSKDRLSQSILEQDEDYHFFKRIAIMKLSPTHPAMDFSEKEMTLVSVTSHNVGEFAWLYLRCFEAENRHAESVEENFLHKLNVPGMKFYFIQRDQQKIGITGLYQNPDFQILSVAAVLPDFRNLGFHKSALSWRIRTCKEMNSLSPIFSWAYQNSISHQNMIKVGMSPAQEIWVYQHVE
jgi:hypothetical protein